MSHPDLTKGKILRRVKDDLLTSSTYIVGVHCQLSLGGPIGADVLLCWMQNGLAWHNVLRNCTTLLQCGPCVLRFNGAAKYTSIVWEPVQPTDGPHAYVASRGWIALYWRNPAISFCHMQQIALHQTLQQEWQRHLRQVDGHLGGECRTVGGGTALGLTLDSCLTRSVTSRRTCRARPL